jgi:hypothetical protein
MNILRWVLVLPAFLVGAFVAYLIAFVGAAIGGMGLKEASDFIAASDMQNYWVSGTDSATLIL